MHHQGSLDVPSRVETNSRVASIELVVPAAPADRELAAILRSDRAAGGRVNR